MRNGVRGVWSSLLMVGGLSLGMAAPAMAGDILAWRTQDGGYAFADDPDAVPERYRDQVEVRRSASIAGYRRYTAEDEAATTRYEEALAARLDYLRARGAAGEAAPGSATGQATMDYVTVRSGARRSGAGVDVSTAVPSGDAPLQVDKIYVRRKGGVLTQPVRVTRRGDKVISVEKPRKRWRSLADVVSEQEFDASHGLQ